MKINTRIGNIVAAILAVITMCLAILHFFNYFNGSIDIMMIFLGLTTLMGGFNQINMINEKSSNDNSKVTKISGMFSVILGIGIVILVSAKII